MSCEVCGAPSIPVKGACVFCRSPLAAAEEWTGLLDYVASRLPAARATHGLVRRREVRSLKIEAGNNLYTGRVRGDGALELHPEKDPGPWVEGLLRDLTRDAAADRVLRAAITRAGWAWR